MKKTVSLILSLLVSSAALVCVPASGAGALYDGDKIIAFGDSITAAGVWENGFASLTGESVINAGVGGDSSGTARSRFNSAVISKSPDVVIIGFGMNDAAVDMAKYVSLADFRSNLSYYIDSCLAIGAKVIVTTPNPIGEDDYYTRHDKTAFEQYGGADAFLMLYVAEIKSVVSEKGVTLADVNAEFRKQSDPVSFLSDGVHPTNAGYALYASVIERAYYRLVIGDLDNSGSIGGSDYLMLKRAVLGTFELSKRQEANGDINNSGGIDAVDYLMLKRAVLGTYSIG